jgi:protein SCO1
MIALAALFWLGWSCALAALDHTPLEHAAKGIVLKIDAAHRSLIVSCEAIPNYMDAMEMPFVVRDSSALAGLKPGMAVNFTIIARGKNLVAENIRVRPMSNLESEPLEAGQLTVLHKTMNPNVKALTVGDRAPDFVLTDQAGKEIHLSQFIGKVVLLTFGYSRCPNPNYCFRLSNNMARVEKRFHDQAGRDLVLITIVIDPEHDQGSALVAYADVWKADPAVWHFLTGPLPEIQQVAGMFGMNFWSDDVFVTHSLHTVILDRRGQLAVNLEGNQFTAEELGDLVQTVMTD